MRLTPAGALTRAEDAGHAHETRYLEGWACGRGIRPARSRVPSPGFRGRAAAEPTDVAVRRRAADCALGDARGALSDPRRSGQLRERGRNHGVPRLRAAHGP